MPTVTIAGCDIQLREFECLTSEWSKYGQSIYLCYIPCRVWEALMPDDTIRESSLRGRETTVWYDFIRADWEYSKDDRLNQFVDKLSSRSGRNFYVASRNTMPDSVYQRFVRKGLSFPGDQIMLVCYANNARYAIQNNRTGASSSSGSSGSFCFLTTAMWDYYGKPDDCDELNVLRQFRDNWMSQNEEGRQLISEYYEIAPAIVKAIDEDFDVVSVYSMIRDVIYHCLDLLGKGDNQGCLDSYKEMVQFLADKYGVCRIKV